MTDEELRQTIQELGEDIDRLSDPDKPLTAEEDGHRRLLLLKRETLQKLKEAREKHNVAQELNQTLNYGLLSAVGERHPVMAFLARLKLRSHIHNI